MANQKSTISYGYCKLRNLLYDYEVILRYNDLFSFDCHAGFFLPCEIIHKIVAGMRKTALNIARI